MDGLGMEGFPASGSPLSRTSLQNEAAASPCHKAPRQMWQQAKQDSPYPLKGSHKELASTQGRALHKGW